MAIFLARTSFAPIDLRKTRPCLIRTRRLPASSRSAATFQFIVLALARCESPAAASGASRPTRRGVANAEAPARTWRQLHRHRRFLWAGRLGEAHPRGAASL